MHRSPGVVLTSIILIHIITLALPAHCLIIDAIAPVIQDAFVSTLSRFFFNKLFENVQPMFNIFLGGATGLVMNEILYTSPFPLATEFWAQRALDLGNLILGYLYIILDAINISIRSVNYLVNFNIVDRIDNKLTFIQRVIAIIQNTP